MDAIRKEACACSLALLGVSLSPVRWPLLPWQITDKQERRHQPLRNRQSSWARAAFQKPVDRSGWRCLGTATVALPLMQRRWLNPKPPAALWPPFAQNPAVRQRWFTCRCPVIAVLPESLTIGELEIRGFV